MAALRGAGLLAVAALLALAAVGGQENEVVHLAALQQDDECSELGSDQACTVSALQQRGGGITSRTQADTANQGWQEAGDVDADVDVEVVDGEPSTHPPLCDPSTVARVCERVNRLTVEYWGTAADADPSIVHAAELSEQLMVSRESLLDYLKGHIQVTNLETDPKALAAGSFGVACTELCSHTIQAIPAAQLPPTANVGCYLPKGAKAPKCDVDLSGRAFKDVTFDDNDPLQAASKFAETPHRGTSKQETPPQTEEEAITRLVRNSSNAHTPQELKVLEALNYPLRSRRQLRIAIANLFRIYPLVEIAIESSPTLDQALVGSALETGSQRQQLGAQWEDDVQKVAVSAQAFVAVALSEMNTPKAETELVRWFGSKSSTAQKEVRRVLNGIHALLSNVVYEYPGPQCGPSTYAYVHPGPPGDKNSKGQYKFYLCDTYMRTSLAEQIETLVHESSHHQTMSCDDVCFSEGGSTCTQAYGRSTCKRLAEKNPQEALHNADNFAYFANDMQPNPPRPDCPTYRQCGFEDFCGCPAGMDRHTLVVQGKHCYTCVKAAPPGSSREIPFSSCRLFPCRRSRNAYCKSGRCSCHLGLHASNGQCVEN